MLLLVPLVSLSALWAFATSITLGDGLNLRNVQTIQDHLGYPAGALGSALQQERRLSVVFAGSKMDGDRASMASGRLVTDRQVDLFRRLATADAAQNAANAQAKQRTSEILRDLDLLAGKRQSIDTGALSREQIFAFYSEQIGDTLALQTSLSTLSNPDVTKDAKTEVSLAEAREKLSQEDALLAGALAAGHLTFPEHVQFTKLVGTQRALYAQAEPELRTSDHAFYQRIIATPEYTRLQALEDRFTNHMPAARSRAGMTATMPGGQGGGMPADVLPGPDTGVQWKTTASSVLTRFRGLELGVTASASARAKPIADGIILRVVLAGALGLVAVIASLILSLWVGRSVIHELNGLRRAALELAGERLPNVIRRLRRGEDVDATAEAPPLSFSTQEIDQVGQAFNVARRTAIQGAIEEAGLRRSISDVFLNLARRNQALLHRQLSLLDAMERRIAEPDELEDLFRLDHLATRMRRHAEGLIILSGQAPGRGWRNPVPAVDVARAAAAEVEDYARVTVAAMPRVAISGPAVADLIHLLAELVENATLFSPPDTTVQVSGQVVAHGFAIEVEDRGLSMDPASLNAANDLLANPPEFDLSNSAQLGLFVVGRLAKRHDIQVTLRTSPYGGTTAIVLLSDAIVSRSGEQPEIESPRRLAVTRRGEEALVPIGTIGSPPPHANGVSDRTGPMPLTQGGDQPVLPHRDGGPRSGHDIPTSYDAGSHLNNPQRRSPHNASSRDTDDHAPGSYDAGTSTPHRNGAGSYGSGSRASGYGEPNPYGGSGGHDSGSRSSYDDRDADTGKFRTPATGETGGRPPLPRRTSDGGGDRDGTQPSRRSFDDEDPGPSLPQRGSGGLEQGRPPLPRRLADKNPDTASSSRSADLSPPSPPAEAPQQRRSLFEPHEEHASAPERAAEQEGARPSLPSLPRRVRQANLAPQLRDASEPAEDVSSSGERSPEELRTMLSSIQKGWLRGRSDSAQTDKDHKEEDI